MPAFWAEALSVMTWIWQGWVQLPSLKLLNGTLATCWGAAIGAEIFESDLGTIRGELELGFASLDVDSGNINGTVFPATGNIESVNILFNVWQDLDTNSALTPFVGGGIGVAFVGTDYSHTNGLGGQVVHDNTTTAFAFQAGAGVRYEINPSMMVSLGYHFRGTADFDYVAANTTGVPRVSYDSDGLMSHNIVAGLTIKFAPLR
jgi:outer membrane immunogenic protein